MKNLNDEKIVELKKMFDDHYSMPFPHTTSHEELQDIKAELSLYDGHIAGLVSSYLQDADVNPEFVTKDNELEQQLLNFKPSNKEEEKSLSDLQTYKNKIDEMVDLLVLLLKLPPST